MERRANVKQIMTQKAFPIRNLVSRLGSNYVVLCFFLCSLFLIRGDIPHDNNSSLSTKILYLYGSLSEKYLVDRGGTIEHLSNTKHVQILYSKIRDFEFINIEYCEI